MPACELELCDIEDAVSKDDITPNDRIIYRNIVLPKKRLRSARKVNDELPVGDSIIPGTQKIYIKTWGCSHNNSDGEYMAGQLAAYGYKITGWCNDRISQRRVKSAQNRHTCDIMDQTWEIRLVPPSQS